MTAVHRAARRLAKMVEMILPSVEGPRTRDVFDRAIARLEDAIGDEERAASHAEAVTATTGLQAGGGGSGCGVRSYRITKVDPR